jgi:hypothetical protein
MTQFRSAQSGCENCICATVICSCVEVYCLQTGALIRSQKIAIRGQNIMAIATNGIFARFFFKQTPADAAAAVPFLADHGSNMSIWGSGQLTRKMASTTKWRLSILLHMAIYLQMEHILSRGTHCTRVWHSPTLKFQKSPRISRLFASFVFCHDRRLTHLYINSSP